MRKCSLFFTLLLLIGCTSTMSYQEIVDTAQSTNVSDGVDRSEAIVLAQNFMIETGMDQRHSVYRVGEVRPEGEYWLIHFNSGIARGASATRRFDFVAPLLIKVHKHSGEVRR